MYNYILLHLCFFVREVLQTRSLVLVYVVCLFTGCFDLQDHEIIVPEFPNYTFSGYTRDIQDTSRLLVNIPVTLTSEWLVYNVTFAETTVFSDSTGYFAFERVHMGNYYLSAARGGYTTERVTQAVGPSDTSRILDVPAPLVYLENIPGASGALFDWSSLGLWTTGMARSMRISEGLIPVVYLNNLVTQGSPPHLVNATGNYKDKSRITWYYKRIPFDQPEAFEFVGRMFYWFYQMNVSECVLDLQSKTDVIPINEYRVDDNLSSMAWDGSGFWTTFGSNLQFRGRDLRSALHSWPVDAGHLTALACDNNSLWAWDAGREVVLKMDQEGKIILVRRLFGADHDDWIVAEDLDMSPWSTLWVYDQYKGFYEFIVHDLDQDAL